MKKRIELFLVMFCLVIILPAKKSKDVTLKLDFRTLYFDRSELVRENGEITIQKQTGDKKPRFDNYIAYSGRSLTLILTDVNPFFYTIVINGDAHENYIEQKEFNEKMNQAVKDYQSTSNKADERVQNQQTAVRSAVTTLAPELINNKILTKNQVEGLQAQETYSDFIAQVKGNSELERIVTRRAPEAYLVGEISNLQARVTGFYEDIKCLHVSFTKMINIPSLGYRDIVKEFVFLASSRFSKMEIGSEMDENELLRIRGYIQAQISDIRKEKNEISGKLSGRGDKIEDIKKSLDGVQQSIDAIEKVAQLFNEGLVQFRESCFTIRDVFPTIHGDEFVIRIKVFKKDSAVLLKEMQPIRIHIENGIKIDFSAGLALGLNSADDEYVLVESEENDEKQILERNSTRLASPIPFALVHVYPRWLGRWIKWDGICFGMGLNLNQTVNYYFGTGVSLSTKRPINPSNNNKIINDRRFVVNFGVMLAKIKKLAPRFKGISEVDKGIELEDILKDSYRIRPFIGISYNFD